MSECRRRTARIRSTAMPTSETEETRGRLVRSASTITPADAALAPHRLPAGEDRSPFSLGAGLRGRTRSSSRGASRTCCATSSARARCPRPSSRSTPRCRRSAATKRPAPSSDGVARDVRRDPRRHDGGRDRPLAAGSSTCSAGQFRAEPGQFELTGAPEPLDLSVHLPRLAGGPLPGRPERAPALRGGGRGAHLPERRRSSWRRSSSRPRLAEPTYGLAAGVLVGRTAADRRPDVRSCARSARSGDRRSAGAIRPCGPSCC